MNRIEGLKLIDADDFASLFKATDRELHDAILKSNRSFGQFANAFRSRAGSCSDFVCSVVAHVEESLIPLGILVSEISGDTIRGRLFANSKAREYKFLGEISCTQSKVIDWRYAEVFELRGGVVYLTLLRRLGRLTRVGVTSERDFYIREVRSPYETEVRDDQVLEGARLVLNGDAKEFSVFLEKFPGAVDRRVWLPDRRHSQIGFRIEFGISSLREFAVAYGSTSIYETLRAHKLLENPDEKRSLICKAAFANNLAGMQYLVKHGFRFDEKFGAYTVLHIAVMEDYSEMVDWILSNGGHNSIKTEEELNDLMRSVKSARVAELLIKHKLVSVELMERVAKHHIQSSSYDKSSVLTEVMGMNEESEQLKEKHLKRMITLKNNGLLDLKAHFPEHSEDIDGWSNLDVGSVLPLHVFSVPR